MLVICVLLVGARRAVAQYDKEKDASIPLENFYVKKRGPGILRLLLSKVHWGLSTGYAPTTFKHTLEGFSLYQETPTSAPVLFRTATPTIGYANWFNRSVAEPLTLNPGFVVNSDTEEIGYESKSFHIPLKLTAHVEFLQRYRAGLGYSFEFTRVGDFEPISFGDDLNNLDPGLSSFFLKKYFVVLGASVYRYYEYLLTVDVNVGGYGLGSNFDKSIIKRGVFFNLGATVERDMSEYFKVFVRPSYEIRSFTLTPPDAGVGIKHKFNAFYVNVGVSYRLPELRRCYNKDCRAQINHTHGDRQYRSRVHPIYKKQNPHYGENYPNLLKYKGKNKRKLNPY